MSLFPCDQAGSRLLLKDYTDATAETDYVGIHASDGTINVTILVDENTWTGLYAQNGSINVVEGAALGVYSPCGALNVTIP